VTIAGSTLLQRQAAPAIGSRIDNDAVNVNCPLLALFGNGAMSDLKSVMRTKADVCDHSEL
jgi:hypothetical protein